ncbi:hypothetical protein [Roseovarius sp. 2305UL8-3]|uniref:hypothetical protein n=1 Tax=Roseovarius conchicola TaxID=3121636 RepID=UPI0035277F9A
MRPILFAAPILVFLAACGETPLEQGVFGAGVGLGTAAVLDGNLAAGAAIGAAGNLLYCQTNPNRC